MASCPTQESYGYEDSRFEKEVDENFHCSICYNVLKEPRMCGNNEHMFCLACITQHLNVNSETCPECNEHLTVDTLRRPRVLNNYLSKLKINCDYASRGCPELTCVEALKTHVANCGFAPVLCSNEGCGMEINKKDKIYHETVVCEHREVNENVETIIQEMKKAHVREMKESIDEMKEVKKEVKYVKENLSKVTKDVDEIKVVMGQLLEKLNIPNPFNKLPFAEYMLNTTRKGTLISGGNRPLSSPPGFFSGFSPPPVYPGFNPPPAPVYSGFGPLQEYQGFSSPEEYSSFGPPGLIHAPFRPPPGQPIRPKNNSLRLKRPQNVTKFQDPLNPSILAQASAADQKEMLGERLFPLIQQTHPDLAGKITGMLLEIDNAKLLHMLESPDALAAKVDEAVAVLQAHQAREAIQVPARDSKK